MVGCTQRIGQLDTEAEVLFLAQIQQAAQHRAGLIEFEIMLKRCFLDDQIVETTGVENFAYTIETQQCWIEFDEGVDRLDFEHVAADRFDLLGWAAVHGRQRDPLDQARGDASGQALQLRPATLQAQTFNETVIGDPFFKNALVFHKLRMRGRIDAVVNEGLHRRLLDAVEVVAHAHIETERLGFAFSARVKHRLQQMQCKPGFQVFVKGFRQGVFR